ncbi:sigma-54-dependent Fis family transcriptional regulator [Mesobacillus foraminis]|uniref:DNA-binding NtrC family response regulator n=1 Tax=Mesobacillus foraminis TaxID=279826 RepID=A0A4R2BJ84_9BACI|nr:sigma-54-dependent transcriptional regulator [Mesobacillus foraminis]TCN26532.1 DNA-binding NtrC family response regulator [Mesobacillus foraminis]
MKIKVLFIAPYPALTVLAEECGREVEDMEIDVKVANLEAAIPIAQSAEQDGYDVIISRGGTARLMEEETSLPIIDVHVSGYDMLRVLTLANDFPGKKAIVGFSNITLGAKTITDILDFPTEVFTVEVAEEVEPLVRRLKEEGFHVIMGDVVTVNAADRHGLEGILIQSGREAIFDAFDRVRTTYAFNQKTRSEIELLKAVLAETSPDFIVFNSGGEIVFEQWKAVSPEGIETWKLAEGIGTGPLAPIMLESANGDRLKADPKKITVRNEEYHLLSFMKLEGGLERAAAKLEAVRQLPMLIRESTAMKECISSVEANLPKSRWMLIGEKGTGKRQLARYIHYAKQQGKGLFAEMAAGDFIDGSPGVEEEIQTLYIHGTEELNSGGTVKLLEKAEALRGIDLIISLEKEESTLHSLFYAEDTARIYLPPLRNRVQDIRTLAAYFIADSHQQRGTSPIKIKEEAVALLEAYSWPGNVAELKALVQDAAALEKGYVLGKEKIETLLKDKTPASGTAPGVFLQGSLEEIEKRIILAVLEQEDGNQTRVAKRLGMNRSTLWRKLKD